MKPKIIISETSSRFTDSIKNNLSNHYEYIDSYIIHMSEIFKAFDIIKPDHIILSYKDIKNTTVKLFINSLDPKHPVTIETENHNHINIIDSKIYFNQNLVRNNKLAIILDGIDMDRSVCDTLDAHNISYNIFDAPNYPHKYNLGLLDRVVRANIINQYYAVASFNSLYVAETTACNGLYYGLEYLDNIISRSNTPVNNTIVDINQYIEKNLYARN